MKRNHLRIAFMLVADRKIGAWAILQKDTILVDSFNGKDILCCDLTTTA